MPWAEEDAYIVVIRSWGNPAMPDRVVQVYGETAAEVQDAKSKFDILKQKISVLSSGPAHTERHCFTLKGNDTQP